MVAVKAEEGRESMLPVSSRKSMLLTADSNFCIAQQSSTSG